MVKTRQTVPVSRGGAARWGRIAGPLLAAVLLLFFDLDPDRPEVTRTAAVAVLMAVWWMTEALPLGVTALLPVVLFPTLGIMSGKTVAPGSAPSRLSIRVVVRSVITTSTSEPCR